MGSEMCIRDSCNLVVMKWCAKIWGALEDREVSDGLSDFGDGLNAGGARPDNPNTFSSKVDRFVGPITRMKTFAFEVVNTVDDRHNGDR